MWVHSTIGEDVKYCLLREILILIIKLDNNNNNK